MFKGCPPCPRGAVARRRAVPAPPGGAAASLPHPSGVLLHPPCITPGCCIPLPRASPQRTGAGSGAAPRPRSGHVPAPVAPLPFPHPSIHRSLRRCPARAAGRSERRRRPWKSCVPAGGKAGRGGRGKTTTPKCSHEFPSARPASEISPIRAVRGGSRLTFPHRFTATFGRQAGTAARSAPELADLFGISLLCWRRAACAKGELSNRAPACRHGEPGRAASSGSASNSSLGKHEGKMWSALPAPGDRLTAFYLTLCIRA